MFYKVSFETYIVGKIKGEKVSQKKLDTGKLVNVQCFPLYSILLAQRTNKYWLNYPLGQRKRYGQNGNPFPFNFHEYWISVINFLI